MLSHTFNASPILAARMASTLFAAGLTSLASAADLDLQPAAVVQPSAQAASSPAPTAASLASAPARVEYAAEGSRWWMVTGGWGHGLSHTEESKGDDFNLAASYSYFMVKDVEFNVELGAWYHQQPGTDAQSLNPSMVFRWHFIDHGDWTVYADVGIGVLLATDDVPQGGTPFDFTPRVGLGFTHRIGDGDTRLVVGVRWAHFSNARLHGDDDNPSRDDAMFYGGLIFPF
jgi:hypothetical protein